MIKKWKHYINRIKEGRLKNMEAELLWVWQYSRRHWLSMVLFTLFGLSGTVVSLLSSFISKDLVDMITGHHSGKLLLTFGYMILTQIGTNLITQATMYISQKINLKVENDIKADVFEKILVADWESLSNYHSGELLVRWNSDVSRISSGVLNFIPNIVIYIFQFASALFMVIRYDWTFALFSIISIPLSIGISRLTVHRMRKMDMGTMQATAQLSRFNQETFSNIQLVKAFDTISDCVKKLRSLQKDYIDTSLKFQKIQMSNALFMAILSMIVSYSAYGWGIYRVWSGAITYGTMTMFLSLSGTLTSAANKLISLLPSFISITTSARRLMTILDLPREDYSQKEEVAAFYEEHKNQGVGILVNNIDYSYQTGTAVFENASMEAYPHEIVAFVGPSGEGKTTMLRVLLSLVRPQKGNCYICSGNSGINNNNHLDLTPSTRQLFSYVPQGNSLFTGTIAENMRTVKPDATDDEIIHALKLACAWDFVEKLPDGIDSKIKERGGGFSEGQAQRLSIARALMRKSPILLLDETTSALDVALERQVLRNIMQDDYPRTTIVTTHRPTVLSLCKRVYGIRNKQCVVLSEDELTQMMHDF